MLAIFLPAEELDARISGLAGVEPRKSPWPNQRAYVVAGREFAHFHGRTEIDIRLTRGMQARHRERLRGDPRVGFRGGRSEWVTFALQEAEDVSVAFELIQLAWEANRE